MSESTSGQELQVQDKKELLETEEKTEQGRFYRPLTDVYESADALIVVMEIPGVAKSDVDVKVEQDELAVEARISLEPYGNMNPIYSEYGVGHYTRRFRLSNKVDREGIKASVEDGVLTLTLPKVDEAKVRSIEIR